MSAEAIEAGRRLFTRPCRFVTGAAGPDGVPPSRLPEVCFAGRSNVGKSSLLNALTGQKTLARASVTPGRTRQINFFDLDDRLMLADLPGYGYARAPKTEIAAWTRLTLDYLKGRAQLRRAVLLVDGRVGMKSSDREVFAVLDGAAVSYQVVLTKCEKLSPDARDRLVGATEAALVRRPAAYPSVLATSARSGLGIETLRALLAEFARP